MILGLPQYLADSFCHRVEVTLAKCQLILPDFAARVETTAPHVAVDSGIEQRLSLLCKIVIGREQFLLRCGASRPVIQISKVKVGNFFICH